MSLLDNIQSKNILVIGDVMLDTYFLGEVKRISPEAPVPVFRKREERSVLGGAANVAANLIAAGQNVSMMTMVGNDEIGEQLKSIFQNKKINTELILSLNRHTTEKTRFLTSDNQQVFRLDVEDTEPLEQENYNKLLSGLGKMIASFDIVLISDYLKGLLTYDFTQAVIHKAKEYNIPVIIDVKDPESEKYAGATLLKPNLKELRDLTGRKVESDEEIINASEELRKLRNVKYVLTTCGGRGMALVGNGKPYFIPAFGQEVFDVTGAGDTSIAYLAACMANGFSMKESVNIANLAAGIQVSKVGTSSVCWAEIRRCLAEQTETVDHKVISGRAIESFRKDHEKQKIVFTNGCFDILHIGHIRYLQEASKMGDILIVGLNSDTSVKRLKGSERPINTESERAEMLGALRCVDYVAIFEGDTPYELIRIIQPDILVKGGDYRPEEVVGRDIVEARGGRLEILGFTEGKSTTEIINKIREREQGDARDCV